MITINKLDILIESKYNSLLGLIVRGENETVGKVVSETPDTIEVQSIRELNVSFTEEEMVKQLTEKYDAEDVQILVVPRFRFKDKLIIIGEGFREGDEMIWI